jgi:predicted DNA-binding ribbon-helix-helix protein
VSTVKKRSVSLSGHRTSYSIEDAFFQTLQSMAVARSMPLAQVIAKIDEERPRGSNLSSALRLAALEFVKSENRPVQSRPTD